MVHETVIGDIEVDSLESEGEASSSWVVDGRHLVYDENSRCDPIKVFHQKSKMKTMKSIILPLLAGFDDEALKGELSMREGELE